MQQRQAGKRRREQIVAFIGDFWQQYGYSPSLTEIARAVGCSVQTTSKHLAILQSSGVLTRQARTARSIVLEKGVIT